VSCRRVVNEFIILFCSPSVQDESTCACMCHRDSLSLLSKRKHVFVHVSSCIVPSSSNQSSFVSVCIIELYTSSTQKESTCVVRVCMCVAPRLLRTKGAHHPSTKHTTVCVHHRDRNCCFPRVCVCVCVSSCFELSIPQFPPTRDERFRSSKPVADC